MTSPIETLVREKDENHRRDDFDELVDRARESNGDEVILPRRIGASPYFRYTPYRNNRGTVVNMWSCISVIAKPMPQKTILHYPRVIDPSENDRIPVRMYTTERVKQIVRRSLVVKLYPVEETPFGGLVMEWYND